MRLPRALTLVASVMAGSIACSEGGGDQDKKNADAVVDSGTNSEQGNETLEPGDASQEAPVVPMQDAAVAMMPDAMPPAMMPDAAPMGPPANLVVKSNLTGVTFKQDADDNEGLRVTSFAYYQDAPNSAGYYTNFYIGLKNFGSKLLCFPTAQIVLKGASGNTLFDKMIYVDSDTKYESLGSLIECLAPGQETAGWTNDLPSSGTAASSIREVTFDLEADVRDIKPVEMPPKLISATAYDRFGTGDAAFMGTVKVGAKAIDFPSVLFYVRDAGGFFRDQAKANQSGGLAAGADWAFATTACSDTSVALAKDTLPVIDYRFSNKSKSRVPSEDDARLAEIEAAENARDALAERAGE